MLDPHLLVLFLAAALVILVVPGPAVLYIVARSVDQGRVAGVVSVLGVSAGSLVHVAAATLGVSALLAASATAFTFLKYLGAAYLIYLGIRRLMERGAPDRPVAPVPMPLARLFLEGMVVNVLNPKTALFFLAFLPQFVDPARAPVSVQMVLLGIVFVLLGVLSDGLYAMLAGTFGNRMRASAAYLRVERGVSGGLLIALGLATALTGQSRK